MAPRKSQAKPVPHRDADRTSMDLPPANQTALTAEEIATRDPEGVPDYLARARTPSGRPGLQAFGDELLAKVDVGNPKALNLYAKIMKLVQAQHVIVEHFVRRIGGTPERARTGVTLLSKVEGLSEDDAAATVEPFLRKYYARRGKKLLIVKEDDQT